jgi:DNA-binding NtrC family response regulator
VLLNKEKYTAHATIVTMSKRSKILIIEHDDFLREIVGNLLHKEGYYILNGDTIEHGISTASSHDISLIIIGSSCPDYREKKSINFLRTHFPEASFLLLNTHDHEVDFVPIEQQVAISRLSVQEILMKSKDILGHK